MAVHLWKSMNLYIFWVHFSKKQKQTKKTKTKTKQQQQQQKHLKIAIL